MKKIIFALVVVFSMVFVFSLTAQNKKKAAKGVWKYEIEQAPYGYDKGTLEIKEYEKEISGVVNFNSGYSVQLQKMTMSNDTLRAYIFVDSESIDIVAKIGKTKMEGTANSSMGRMNFKADKVVENQE